ncbi:MAG: flagellar hook-length control protein FliK [Defluviitaleaceae bacterium]|nr:flagellar hook-length control protein FliK [Defluviitaleaceae bacterium]
MKIQNDNTNFEPGKIPLTEQKPAAQQQNSILREGISQASGRADSIKEMLTDALIASGFSTSKENIKLAMMLMEKNLPVNKETLAMIKQAMTLLGADNEARALLLVLNSLEPSVSNIKMLSSYISGDVSLLENIKSISNFIIEVDDPVLKEKLIKILSNNSNLSETKVLADKQTLEVNSNTNIGASTDSIKPTALNSETLISELTKSINQTIAENKTANVNDMFQNIDKLTEQIINKLPADLSALPDIKEAVKNILQEIKSGYSPEEVFKHVTDTSVSNTKESPTHRIIEGEIVKMLPIGENKVVLGAILKNSLETGGSESLIAGSASKTTAELAKMLSYDPTNTTNKDLNRYLNELSDKLELIRQVLSDSPQSEATQRLFTEVTTMHENLNFFAHMKNNMFLQLPLNISDHLSNSELYIMKNNKSRSKKNGGLHSALIAIDTAFMGRFEAYVQRDENNVNIQFRTETESVEKLVKGSIQKLITALEQHGYRLDGCMYKRLAEPFTLEDTVKDNEFLGNMTIGFDKTSSFDIRG